MHDKSFFADRLAQAPYGTALNSPLRKAQAAATKARPPASAPVRAVLVQGSCTYGPRSQNALGRTAPLPRPEDLVESGAQHVASAALLTDRALQANRS